MIGPSDLRPRGSSHSSSKAPRAAGWHEAPWLRFARAAVHLFQRAEDVSVILLETPHTGQPTQRPRQLVSVKNSKISKPKRHLPPGPWAVGKHQTRKEEVTQVLRSRERCSKYENITACTWLLAPCDEIQPRGEGLREWNLIQLSCL